MSTQQEATAQGQSAAEGRRRWAATMESAGAAISSRMIEIAAIGPGSRVLDIATGTGDPAIPAARVVGPKGSVVGIDTMDPLLALARERAAAERLKNISFVAMDAEKLAFPPASFDAIFCKFGLMFFRDYAGVVETSFRLLDSGGAFVASIWGEPTEVPAISITMDVLRDQLDIRPAETPPHPFALSDPSILLQTFTAAGFTDLRVEPVPVVFEFDTPDQYMHYMHDVAHQVNLLFQEITPGERTTIWDAIVARASEYRTSDGVVRFENRAMVVAGRRV